MCTTFRPTPPIWQYLLGEWALRLPDQCVFFEGGVVVRRGSSAPVLSTGGGRMSCARLEKPGSAAETITVSNRIEAAGVRLVGGVQPHDLARHK